MSVAGQAYAAWMEGSEKEMGRYLIRRLLQAVLMLFLMSIAFFTLLHLIPGGPEEAVGAQNPRITVEAREAIKARYGLDKPVPVQYVVWLSHAVRLDFGDSIATTRPVLREIGDRLPATFELFLAAFSLALTAAVVFGVLAAVKQY